MCTPRHGDHPDGRISRWIAHRCGWTPYGGRVVKTRGGDVENPNVPNRPDDVYEWAARWDEQLARALPALRQVVQPLWDLVPAPERAALEAAFEKKAFASIGEHLVRLRARV